MEAQDALVSSNPQFCVGTSGRLTNCTPNENHFTRRYEPRNAFVFETSAGTCLDGSNGKGNPVLLAPCDGSLTQDWYISKERQIQNKANNLCLDVSGERFQAGTPVILWDCKRGSNQIFALAVVARQTPEMNPLVRESLPLRDIDRDGELNLRRDQVIAAGGGNVIGNATANLIGQAGSNVIGNASGNYTVASVDGGASEPASLAGSARAIAAGTYHSCALTTGGHAYCWGSAAFSTLGDGTVGTSSTPPPIAGSMRFASLDAGNSHACALSVSGQAYCWGRNGEGQLGDGTRTLRIEPVAVSP